MSLFIFWYLVYSFSLVLYVLFHVAIQDLLLYFFKIPRRSCNQYGYNYQKDGEWILAFLWLPVINIPFCALILSIGGFCLYDRLHVHCFDSLLRAPVKK